MKNDLCRELRRKAKCVCGTIRRHGRVVYVFFILTFLRRFLRLQTNFTSRIIKLVNPERARWVHVPSRVTNQTTGFTFYCPRALPAI